MGRMDGIAMKLHVIGILITAFLVSVCNAATIWTGPVVTVVRPDGTDPTLAANQDRLTPSVWLTRSGTRGLYNIKAETNYTDKTISPIGTTWAFQGVEGNPNNAALMAATNYANLNFDSFANALGGQVGNVILGRKGVLHLIAEDVYVDITFTSWSAAGGGGFAYVRSSATDSPSDVPLLPPGGMWLFVLAVCGIGSAFLIVPAAKSLLPRISQA